MVSIFPLLDWTFLLPKGRCCLRVEIDEPDLSLFSFSFGSTKIDEALILNELC